MKGLLILAGLLLLALPTKATAQAADKAGLNNAVILIIRHGEKPKSGADLSKAGKKRAKAYVQYFRHFTVDSQPLAVDYLFAAADSKESHRARLTLEPFSKAAGLKIDSRFRETQATELVRAIRSKPAGKQFLICWHHGEIPRLVTALGADPAKLFPDGKWPDDVYGWVVQLRYGPDGGLLEARRIDEKLMPDDSNKRTR